MLRISSIHILVVDDIPDNLRLLAEILESQNYVVRKALNGNLALQSAHRHPPDLILLDINMPEMNGYEVCQRLQTSDVTSHIPIIFISALDQVHDKVRAFELGGKDYITKPFQAAEVLARVRNHLLIQHQRHRLEQEIRERQMAEINFRRLNAKLERQVQVRTLELQQSLKFELTLKRISDKVRDSLDCREILQNAVKELAIALEVDGCDAALYSLDRQSSLISYQYATSGVTKTQGQLLNVTDAPEIYSQLQRQLSCFAFCQVQPPPIRQDSAILACPIFDDQIEQAGILGDLWVFKDRSDSFSDMEIRLVKQVANHCAIALRKAKLYETAQAQIQELQRLKQLSNQFVSTMIHELRSPIASIKMAIELLSTLVISQFDLEQILRCIDVLERECDREISLIENLLYLQNLEAGQALEKRTTIHLPEFILEVIEPFKARTQKRQQFLLVDLAEDLPTLTIEAFSLNRIITELLTNACKYTPAGETILVAINCVNAQTDPDQPISLQIVVMNRGVELTPEQLPHIFDQFYRISSHDHWKQGGTGLGLALVNKLVEQLGGTIEVESKNNQTCFTVQLKITPDNLTSA